MMTTKNGRIFTTIEACRGVAATLVVLDHASGAFFANSSYWRDPAFGGLFAFGGSAGVLFFFVLSGFIITYAHQEDIGRPDRLSNYVERRFTRVFPFYWAVLLAVYLAFISSESMGGPDQESPLTLLNSIALVGYDAHDNVIDVSWTLYHEMLFYSLFGLAIWRRALGVAAITLWWMVCLLMPVAPHYAFSGVNLTFMYGVIATMIYARCAVVTPRLLAAIGAMLFFAAGVDQAWYHLLSPSAATTAYGLSGAVIILGLAESERRGLARAGKMMMLMGRASYAIYLTHLFALPVLARVVRAVGGQTWLPANIWFVIVCAAAIGGGILIHRLVEVPLMRLAREVLARRRPLTPA